MKNQILVDDWHKKLTIGSQILNVISRTDIYSLIPGEWYNVPVSMYIFTDLSRGLCGQ